jgi:hypothetical protein
MMKSLSVIKIEVPSFAMLVKRLKRIVNDADVFELNLDAMLIKGDLAVILHYFGKPIIARSETLDLLRRGIKAGFPYAIVPKGMELNLEFTTLVNNKKAILLEDVDGKLQAKEGFALDVDLAYNPTR